MSIKRIIFWQNVPSIHQSAFIKSLACMEGLDVWFAYEEDLPQSRMKMGWTIPDFGDANIVDSRNETDWKQLVLMNDDTSLHAFGSYFLLPKARAAFNELRGYKCQKVWTSEAFEFYGWKGWLRLQRVRLRALIEARREFERVFAMGTLGVGFFHRAWLKHEQVCEFAYVTEMPNAAQFDTHLVSKNDCVRFLFVGQLIRRKGVDLLLDALAQTSEANWQLDIVGDGELRAELEDIASESGGEIIFHGNLSNTEVVEMMHRADTLILPSRWDGWGAVVNEALLCGTSVIASDACGAAAVLDDERFGEVFVRAQINMLAGFLVRRIKRGRVLKDERNQRSKLAVKCLTGAVLAKYFLDCMQDASKKTPPAPWRTLD